MSEFQKIIVDKLLKKKKKSKRDLANFLKIKENSVNRTLKSPNISFLKLEKIAEFLEVDVFDLLPKKHTAEDDLGEYHLANPKEHNEMASISNLSEALKRSTHTIEMMAETEKSNVKNIENLVKIITEKYANAKPDTFSEK
jgi:DNA-binding Xre family transcriptional regulator